ncbi:MAG: serine/threonine-protein kinase [Myxococcota bacterium]|nr:serine/threonine-protein kinase [Myxococcota bacterium]
MTLISDRYHLLRKIASGGMAEVWLAEQRGPGSFVRRLVIKTIHAHFAEDENLVTAFADEARLAALLHHPHIVRVEDYGEHNGRPYLVMEHLQGQNLKQLASLANGQNLRLPERLVLQLGIQMAEALHYAHQLNDDQGQPLGVVHRDVSPQNIMLMPNGTAKLVDFGIARAASNEGKTVTGTLKGKLAYLSPEQASGKKGIDHRADQFSLSVVLWELLIGSRLFASDSDVSTLKRVAFGDIPSLALYGARYPQPLI